MGNVNDIVTVSITAQANSPTRQSFGIPAILAYHTHNTDLVRQYNDLSGMVADGFTTTEPAYLMATAILSQSPRPPVFKVIRSTTAAVQSFTFTVTANTTGVPVGLSLVDSAGTLRDLYHTPSSQTVNQVATALAAVIDALADYTCTATGPVVTAVCTTGGKIGYPSLTPANSANFKGGFQGGTFAEITADANTEDDLDATLLVDKDWYGIATQWGDSTNITATALWAEANKRIYVFNSADSANLTAASGIIHTMQGLSYKYTLGLFSQTPGGFPALGLMAAQFTQDPGTDTWDLKTIAGATPDDNLTPTQLAAILTNGGNYYTTSGGLRLTNNGAAVGGQFMDLTRGIDALTNDIQISVFAALAAVQKVGYTAKGISALAGEVKSALARFTQSESQPNALLSNDDGFQPVVIVPNIATIPTADKKARILRRLNFTATAEGAIQSVAIAGVISF